MTTSIDKWLFRVYHVHTARITCTVLFAGMVMVKPLPAQLAANRNQGRVAAVSNVQLEITTDSGEKFRLVQASGPIFNVFTETDGKKIGIANTATGEIAPDGPDYGTNGAALERAKAAYIKGQAHPYNASGSVAPMPLQEQGLPGQPASEIIGTVLSFDESKGDATIVTKPQVATKGPIKISKKGNRVDAELIDPVSGQTVPLAVEYQTNGAKAVAGSLGRDILLMGRGSAEVAGSNSLKVILGKDSSFANHEVTVLDSNGNVADASRIGGGYGAMIRLKLRTAAPEIIAALKSYGQSSGTESSALPILYKVAGTGSDK